MAHRQVPQVHTIHSRIDEMMKSAPKVSATNASQGCYYGANAERRLKSSGGGSGGARKPDEQVSVVTGQSFETITSLEAAFVWIQTVAVPILWKDAGHVSSYYQVVGGVRLELQQTKEIPCTRSEHLHSLYGQSCSSEE